jgi:hypothetical protein
LLDAVYICAAVCCSEDDAIILKDVFGYKDAKRLVAESGIPFEAAGLQFLSGFENGGGGEEKEDHDLREGEQGEQEEHKDGQHDSNIDKKKTKQLTVFDKVKDRHFIHDPETGETAWGQQLLQQDGSIFKEVFLYNK